MKQIILQSLSLINFKGIRSLDIQFDPAQTYICGENGTGKTTVFDAFCWCLFGKDSLNRADSNFNIKTLDENGSPILKQEHSVTCVLLVDGNPVKLQRKYCEVWTKPRGTTEETLTNHKTEFLINDVKQSTKKDYDAEISAIIPEDVFKMITNPLFFTSLRPEVQKDMLLEMAGTVEDGEVAALKPEYLSLLSQLNGRPLATFLKEVSARKRAIKDELSTIPASIETAQRIRPEAEDWKALEQELKDKKAKVAEIDAQIADKNQLAEAEFQRKYNIQKQISDKQLELSRRQSDLRSQAESSVSKAQQEVRDLDYKLTSLVRGMENLNREIADRQSQLDRLNQKLVAKRQEFKDKNAEQLTFPEGAFICPTCQRPLEPEDIEAKRNELEANFNRAKAEALKAIQAEGKKLKEQADEAQKLLQDRTAELEKAKQDLDSKEAELEAKRAAVPAVPDVAKIIAEDSTCISLQNEITDLQNQLTQEAKTVDMSDLKEAKAALGANIDELVKRIAKRDQIERADAEIAILEEKRTAANLQLVELEGLEFTATDFQKTKDAELLKRINGMFSLVSFSFVDSQLNGGEKLTCVCTVNGVPYPDVNNAGKINAGLDIINAICKSKGMAAPIFIDNREGVNQLLPTVSQIVNLCVSTDKELTIK